MTSWEDMRSSNIKRARLIIKEFYNSDELCSWVVQWIENTKDVLSEGYAMISTHPATVELAGRFRGVSLSQISDYLHLIDMREGPIHPGKWFFAILLGQANATLSAAALSKGQRYDKFQFFEHEEYGSRETFIAELQFILTSDNSAQKGMWDELDAVISETNHKPGNFVWDGKDSFVRAITEYKKQPQLEEAWETNWDSYIWFKHSVIFTIARQINTSLYFEKIKKISHPVFLDSAFNLPDTTPENDLSQLISIAPEVFDAKNIFQHHGMIMFHLLRVAAKRIRDLGGKGIWKHPLTASDEDEIRIANETVVDAIQIILDSLFLRVDGTSIAWAWLERLIFEGTRRGLWYPNLNVQTGAYALLDTLSLLITGVAQRLELRNDSQCWVLQQEALWQENRVIAVLAVSAFQQEPDKQKVKCAIREALLAITPEFYGEDEAIAQPYNLSGRIGGRCILLVDQPHFFVKLLWQELRPHREQSWHHRHKVSPKSNIGKLFIIWCIYAIEEASGEIKKLLAEAVKEILRDSIQIDVFFGGKSFWASATDRFSKSYGKICKEAQFNTDECLAEFLYVYLDHNEFIVPILVSLNQAGIGLEQLDRVLTRYGFSTSSIVASFLDEQERQIARGYYNPAWLKCVAALSDDLPPKFHP